MLKEAQELEPGQRYMLRIGKIRFGPLSTGIDCEVTVERSGQREIRFVSVPEQGNTDVRVVVDLAPDDSGDTCMTASLAVSPRKPLPKGAPVGFIQRTTNMALRLGLRRMLAKMRTVIESESFTQVA